MDVSYAVPAVSGGRLNCTGSPGLAEILDRANDPSRFQTYYDVTLNDYAEHLLDCVLPVTIFATAQEQHGYDSLVARRSSLVARRTSHVARRTSHASANSPRTAPTSHQFS